MTDLDIKQLQTERRYKKFLDVGIKHLYLLLYLPVGLVVLLVRVVFGVLIVVVGSILPNVSITRNVLSKFFGALFGIVVHTENVSYKRNVKVIISNHISPLDHFVVHIATGCLTPLPTSLPNQLSYSLGIQNFGSSTNLEEFKKTVGAYLINNSTPILFQPENRITNGRAVLKFKEWPFGLWNEVQPVCLSVRRPLLNVSVSTLTSSYWSDVFWYLFCPWTVYNVCFLPAMGRGALSEGEFSLAVQRAVAGGLRVVASGYGATDVLEWEKRHLTEQRRMRIVHHHSGSGGTTSTINNPELHRMATQVKEVLPAVPYTVIFKDLARTKNVDVTISNILEGHVPYSPEPVSAVPAVLATSAVANAVATSSSCSYSQLLTRRDSLCTAASSFPKSAQERMHSFQERKLQLIMTARKRYIDKHGLDALASNNCS